MGGASNDRANQRTTAPRPLAELHVHLEGTAPPALIRRLARRNGVALPDGLFAAPDRFAWSGFLDFLRAYDSAASAIRSAADYRDVSFEYLVGCARQGALYVELIVSPEHADAVGLPRHEQLAGVAQGIDDARAASGIEARVVVTALRGHGPATAERLAAELARERHPYVVGFNLSGDEAGHPPAPFARAYAIAADAGLGCTIHAGEHAGPESVRAALALPIARISHGVRAAEDPALVAELAARGLVLEVCPSSNVATGVYRSLAEHPLPRLRAAGVAITLGSDDPPHFGTSIAGEYARARELGLDDAALDDATRTALTAAFAPAPLRRALLERFARRVGAGADARGIIDR